MTHAAIAPGRCLPLYILPRILLQDLHTGGLNPNISYIARRLSPALRKMSSTPSEVVKPRAITEIKLTQRESQLRGLLLDVARFIDESKEIKERLELRFAGGWVRDKLLGIPSHDIDTTINAMTGSSFTLKMKSFLEDPKNMAKHGLEVKDVGNLHKIAANPEKSKHLETVTTKILGFDVDFVNLRKETYNEHSRNPQMEFGTALEDAERRDATVNALFYNLHTDKVEDYTEGLNDMRSKIMRTPLDPYQTFKDDPLRILRLIRFASRLGFSIHAESEACMGDPAILGALRLKISRERIGTEVEKMLKGMLHYLLAAHLY
jgi:tRNA nucleotidyltransferase (CCA-adding enzyme)